MIWIRWKSNLSGYEYIEPDDELQLENCDITFEVCVEVPEKISMLLLYKQTVYNVDFNGWIKFISDEKHYPQKKLKNQRNFSCNILLNNNYPDITLIIEFNKIVDKDIENLTEKELNDFMVDWDSKHLYGIHDIMSVKDIDTISIEL